jgi:hypothetical protein
LEESKLTSVAAHEFGHALVASVLFGPSSIDIITIRAGGTGETDFIIPFSRMDYEAVVLMAGSVAEWIVTGSASTPLIPRDMEGMRKISEFAGSLYPSMILLAKGSGVNSLKVIDHLDIPHDVDYILVQLAVMGAHLVLDQNRSKLMNGYNLIMPAARRRARVTTGDEFMQICAGI